MKIIRGSDIDFVAASHEDPQKPGVLKKVLAQREDLQAGRVQMLNWARLPSLSSFQSHYHEDMQEVFIIISGSVHVTVNQQQDTLAAGDAIVIDPREIHQMHNPTDSDVSYLVFGITSDQGGKTVVVDG